MFTLWIFFKLSGKLGVLFVFWCKQRSILWTRRRNQGSILTYHDSLTLPSQRLPIYHLTSMLNLFLTMKLSVLLHWSQFCYLRLAVDQLQSAGQHGHEGLVLLPVLALPLLTLLQQRILATIINLLPVTLPSLPRAVGIAGLLGRLPSGRGRKLGHAVIVNLI